MADYNVSREPEAAKDAAGFYGHAETLKARAIKLVALIPILRLSDRRAPTRVARWT
jgi:hypothetical protein